MGVYIVIGVNDDRNISHGHKDVSSQEGTTQKNFTLQKQGNCIQGKAQLALKNWKNLFGDQRKDRLTSFEECHSL